MAAEDVRIALVVKALDMGFFEAARDGGQEAAEELGDVELIYTGPAQAATDAQIEVVSALLAQRPDVIAISANDAETLVPIAERATGHGIEVISRDSGIAPEARFSHLEPSDPQLVGAELAAMMAATMKNEGEFAILSASRTMTNQNAWIAAVKDELQKASLNPFGCLPSRIAPTISGAKQVRGRSRQT